MGQLITPTYWKEVFDPVSKEVDRVQTTEEQAHFISSKLSNDRHRLLLDLNLELCAASEILYVADIFQDRYREKWQELDRIFRQYRVGRFESRGLWLRFDRPFSLYPSSTKGHQHFVLDTSVTSAFDWDTYSRVQYLAYMVGFTDRAWLDTHERCGMSLLIKPGISKEIAYAARRRVADSSFA